MRFHWHVEAGLSAWMPAIGPDDQHRDTDVRTVAAEIEVRSWRCLRAVAFWHKIEIINAHTCYCSTQEQVDRRRHCQPFLTCPRVT